MIYFSKLFHKSLTQHADSECNSTHSIQCGRVDRLKQLLMKSEYRTLLTKLLLN